MLEFLLALLTTATVGVLLIPLLRSRTARRMSCATSAAESSIDWFWQTTQRSACPMVRARASSAGSASTSEGSTAKDGKEKSNRSMTHSARNHLLSSRAERGTFPVALKVPRAAPSG